MTQTAKAEMAARTAVHRTNSIVLSKENTPIPPSISISDNRFVLADRHRANHQKNALTPPYPNAYPTKNLPQTTDFDYSKSWPSSSVHATTNHARPNGPGVRTEATLPRPHVVFRSRSTQCPSDLNTPRPSARTDVPSKQSPGHELPPPTDGAENGVKPSRTLPHFLHVLQIMRSPSPAQVPPPAGPISIARLCALIPAYRRAASCRTEPARNIERQRPKKDALGPVGLFTAGGRCRPGGREENPFGSQDDDIGATSC